MKPEWTEAPEWANYLLDGIGWRWWAEKPVKYKTNIYWAMGRCQTHVLTDDQTHMEAKP